MVAVGARWQCVDRIEKHIMDTFRHSIALLLVLLVPAVFVYWFRLHALFWAPLAAVIVLLEERELGGRFVRRYEEYRDRVARFWPHAPAANHRGKA
jgi:protein-S-isoprenylcysteine O-methyltransferase Ste14